MARELARLPSSCRITCGGKVVEVEGVEEEVEEGEQEDGLTVLSFSMSVSLSSSSRRFSPVT